LLFRDEDEFSGKDESELNGDIYYTI
jgi:hypothetical protein